MYAKLFIIFVFSLLSPHKLQKFLQHDNIFSNTFFQDTISSDHTPHSLLPFTLIYDKQKYKIYLFHPYPWNTNDVQ